MHFSLSADVPADRLGIHARQHLALRVTLVMSTSICMMSLRTTVPLLVKMIHANVRKIHAETVKSEWKTTRQVRLSSLSLLTVTWSGQRKQAIARHRLQAGSPSCVLLLEHGVFSTSKKPGQDNGQISRLSIKRVVPSLAAASTTSGVPCARSPAAGGCRSDCLRIEM